MNTDGNPPPFPEEGSAKQWEAIDNDFILLDDLVYAPLHALAESNQKLQAQIVDAIRNMGTSKQEHQKERFLERKKLKAKMNRLKRYLESLVPKLNARLLQETASGTGGYMEQTLWVESIALTAYKPSE